MVDSTLSRGPSKMHLYALIFLAFLGIVDLFRLQSTVRPRTTPLNGRSSANSVNENDGGLEPMFSVSYDPLEPPTQVMMERDLEDHLMERSLRFFDGSTVRTQETCYLVGLEDKSLNEHNDRTRFTMEESLTELSELAGAAGLAVVGSTYQRVQRPSMEYYIGQGKTKDIQRTMSKLRCTCVIFDAELTPSQQKNLELAFNQDKNQAQIKVIDRTALILDIFGQHARTKEGQLQVQLAMLTYRLPRLTNMWSHLERQSAGSKGRSNGGVGLRGPGEKQLESDRRQMKQKISLLNAAIDNVRRHRSQHRRRRRQLGVPVVALVGYTNAGKSSLLNLLTSASVGGAGTEGVFTADMLFATLDPTTRLVSLHGTNFPNLLMTDTVGFVQKLPTNLVAAFRATLEELAEADLLLHVTDIQNSAWRKQETAVLRELSAMGLDEKPLVTVWNKIDLAPDRKEFLKFEATKRPNTVAVSCQSGEGVADLLTMLQRAVSSQMEAFECILPYDSCSDVLGTIYNLCSLDEIVHSDEGVYMRGRAPAFLVAQLHELSGMSDGDNDMNVYFDSKAAGLVEALEDDEVDGEGMSEQRLERDRQLVAMNDWDFELGGDPEEEFALPSSSGSHKSSGRESPSRSTSSVVGGLVRSGLSTVVVKPKTGQQPQGASTTTKLRPRIDAAAVASRSQKNGRKGKVKRRNEGQEFWEPELEDLVGQGLNADGLVEFEDY